MARLYKGGKVRVNVWGLFDGLGVSLPFHTLACTLEGACAICVPFATVDIGA